MIFIIIVLPKTCLAINSLDESTLNQDDSTKIFKYLTDARIYASQRDYEKAVDVALKAASLSEKANFEYGKYRSYMALEIFYYDAGKVLISAKYKIKAMKSQSRLEAINYERDEKERIEKSEKERYLREEQKQLEIEQQELKLKLEEIAILELDNKSNKSELVKKKSDVVKKQIEIENKKQTIEIQRETINSTFNQLSLTLEELETQRLHSKIFEDSLQLIKKNEALTKISSEKQTIINYLYIVGLSGLIILAASFYRMYTVKLGVQELLLEKNEEIEIEKGKSNNLLASILPLEVIDELKRTGKYEPRYYEKVTLLFANLNNFAQMSELLSPKILIEEVETIYNAFDAIIKRNNLEKIKATNGSYLCIGGLPQSGEYLPLNVIRAAKEIQELIFKLILEKKKLSQPFFEVQIGIHTGPIMSGVVGSQKISFDIWGETVSIASIVQENCNSGKIALSGITLADLKDSVECEFSEKVQMKGRGEIDIYYLNKIIED